MLTASAAATPYAAARDCGLWIGNARSRSEIVTKRGAGGVRIGAAEGATDGGRDAAVGGGVGVAMGMLGCDAVRGSVSGASTVRSSRASSVLGGAGRAFNRMGMVGSSRGTTAARGIRGTDLGLGLDRMGGGGGALAGRGLGGIAGELG